MALLLKKLAKGYLYLNEDLADPRTKSYLFVSSPLYVFMTEAFFNFNWRCEPIDYSTNRLPALYAFYSWIYFLIKVLDLLDTGQFLFLTVMFGQTLLQPDCTYPVWVTLVFLPQNAFMTIMFADFYYKAYIKPTKIQPNDVKQDPKTVIKHD
ncbi:hypothetical protein CBL_00188 [Carabus blaptoides fortunei]